VAVAAVRRPCGVSAALLAASALVLLVVVGGLLPGLGLRLHPVAFASRAAGLAGGRPGGRGRPGQPRPVHRQD
jgi:hypothetical protein